MFGLDASNIIEEVIGGLIVATALAIVTWLVSPKFRSILGMVVKWIRRKWRYFVIFLLLVVTEAILYSVYGGWKAIAFSISHFIIIGLIFWLLGLRRTDVHVARRDYLDEFIEDFQNNLRNWKYEGDWHIEEDEGQKILVATNSFKGGIARPCLLWEDYVFEFETKIVNKYTSWIIRAADIDNYVVLQCHQEKLRPFFLGKGQFYPDEWPVQDLPFNLPLDTWFSVRIEVRGTQVKVAIKPDTKWAEVFNSPLLEQQPAGPDSFPRGSVGFRESGQELAGFRNVYVRRIS